MQKHNSIYVSGHSGLVGSAIIRCLTREGYTNLITPSLQELDLTNQAAVQSFFDKVKPDFVIHAAGKVGGILANKNYPAEYMQQNLIMAVNIIHSAYLSGVRKLMFLGSSCIYPRICPQPIKEEYLLTGELESTNEAYALAKIAGLKMAQHYRSQYGCDFISVMPTNLYGINDHFHPDNSHVLPALIRKMHLAKCYEQNDMAAITKDLSRDYEIAGEQDIIDTLDKFGIHKQGDSTVLSLWGSGAPYREFLFVDDLAEALLFVMQNYSDYSPLNIGTGEDITIRNLAYLIKETVGYMGDINWDTSKPDGTPRKLLDVSHLNALGYTPKTTLKEGLIATYRWYLSR
jgi:GDP-L-fucose synthase